MIAPQAATLKPLKVIQKRTSIKNVCKMVDRRSVHRRSQMSLFNFVDKENEPIYSRLLNVDPLMIRCFVKLQQEKCRQDWFCCPMKLTSTQKGIREEVIKSFWRICRTTEVASSKISRSTAFFACVIFSRVLSQVPSLDNQTFADCAAFALRSAVKFEEKPEVLWDFCVRRSLPIFVSMEGVDFSLERMNQCEYRFLAVLGGIVIPTVVEFFSYFVDIAGWPLDAIDNIRSLSEYLAALSCFVCSPAVETCPPSLLAASCLVLSIKILNGDRSTKMEPLPEVLQVLLDVDLKSLQPVIKTLSTALRNKPEGSVVLRGSYPDWAGHSWS